MMRSINIIVAVMVFGNIYFGYTVHKKRIVVLKELVI